ncbi:MAG: methyltransferase domain-containing protein, partial [Rhodospirillaceae bacterium]|nr:methyltransferase domain-containing protein [Rhodospirillaceae bacterium]
MTERTTDPTTGRVDISDSADFGFRTVAADEKRHLVRGVFDSVASRYDLMNDLMSGGLHRLWKREMMAMLRPSAVRTLLDVAGGTGDVAFLWRRKGGGPAIVCDINAGMVAQGRDRGIDRGILEGVDWLCGDAERLPLPDRSVDAVTIAFGLRNVTD